MWNSIFQMDKKIISAAGFLGMTAIILGAFGAHALKKVLPVEALATFEVGVRYHMYHALFLLFVGLYPSISEKLKTYILRLTLLGIVLFSGSIYLLSTQTLWGLNLKIVGPLTPLGGACLIAAWALLFFPFLKKKA
ncbi:MAG: hypothetical protein RL607_2461 [Bacteroidota bacterium]